MGWLDHLVFIHSSIDGDLFPRTVSLFIVSAVERVSREPLVSEMMVTFLPYSFNIIVSNRGRNLGEGKGAGI